MLRYLALILTASNEPTSARAARVADESSAHQMYAYDNRALWIALAKDV